MNTLLPRLRYTLRQLGWPGALLLATVLGAGLFHLTVTLPLQQREAALLQQDREQERDIARLRQAARKPELGPELRLARFYQSFPPRDSAPVWLEKIYAAAEAQSLVLPKGEYKISPDKSGRLWRYEISLPVSGSYTHLRAFLAQVLEDNPAAMLADLRLRRENIGQEQLDATVRLVVLLRGA
ncbi:hypothetical protein [Pseudogulbenkiania ferrooxidans]|uniref:Putative transmembrane protein n=1 Tax=Pseudogulbenkiania ferrooxidans 2002 TaxID=279714 RepID=B9Z6A3_9NEIS|nr:hypothetical protein [Pseudogulbenkiania ferrooxidans]EEG07747.1 putative transmembrane protein [Pseudogulbenkiania ferrooxidans 2002]